MTTFIICAVLSGIFTLILITPLMQTRPRTCYALMIFVPTILMVGLVGHFPSLFFGTLPLSQMQTAILPAPDYPEEERTLKIALKEKPDDPTIIVDLAQALIAQEKFAEAISLLRDKQKIHLNDEDIALKMATAYFAWGLLYAEQEDYERSLKHLQYALAEAPESAPFRPDINYFIGEVEKKIVETP